MFVYTLGVIFATVYLRYHYTVDVLAGSYRGGRLDRRSSPGVSGLGLASGAG